MSFAVDNTDDFEWSEAICVARSITCDLREVCDNARRVEAADVKLIEEVMSCLVSFGIDEAGADVACDAFDDEPSGHFCCSSCEFWVEDAGFHVNVLVGLLLGSYLMYIIYHDDAYATQDLQLILYSFIHFIVSLLSIRNTHRPDMSMNREEILLIRQQLLELS